MYSVIRHGAYSGTFFIHAGVTLIFLNRFSLLFLILWLGVVVLRIQLEEKLLMQDNRYKEYAKQTRFKMIPFIW
jgi:protein-S-isoprenylcysteine O-methyltransferase Ste14